MNINLSPLELHPAKPIRRAMPRPPHLRQPDYEENFDFMTVFYDCFRSVDASWCVLIGPPLINLEPVVIPALPKLFRCQSTLDVRLISHVPGKSGRNPSTQLWLRTTQSRVALLSDAFRQSEIAVQPNHCDLFMDRKVLLTQSKNNELYWIGDWVRFFARSHGCDAVLFYDNGSTKYELSEIYETISSTPGIKVAVVVRWPYRRGPGGSEMRGLGGSERVDGPPTPWDSTYSQPGILEHARYRFLARAQAVVNADVDELVLTKDKVSLFELLSGSSTGYLRYPGYWIEGATTSAGRYPRHSDFCYRSTNVVESPPKWTVAPGRCSPRATWLPHRITGMDCDALSSLVSFRHFRAIGTDWKYKRTTLTTPNEHDYVKDDEIEDWMQVLKLPEQGA
jgi:hypothetical protein